MLNEGDKFLKDIYKSLSDYNKNFDELLSEPSRNLFTQIYNLLVFHNTKREDRKHDLYEEGMFSRFCSAKRSNTNAFLSSPHPYFCDFVSRDLKAMGTCDHIKVYVPLDYEHLERGANEIFAFLDENNISHRSKVGRRIRFDDLNIRLINKEDLEKLLTFIKNNKYIQEGLLKPNPFAYVCDNISLASDGSLSYNETVTNYIMLYLIDVHKNKKKNITIKDFYHFVIDYYAKTFVSHENLEQFSKDFGHSMDNYNEDPIDIDDYDVYNDHMFVSKLIIESPAEDYSLNRFITHFNLMHNTKTKHITKSKETIYLTLRRMIATMLRKKNPDYKLWNIESYIREGDPYYLTSFEDCRNQICNSSFREDFLELIKSNGLNLRNELLRVYNQVIKLDPEIENVLRDFLAVGKVKYGDEAIYYIRDFLSTGDPTYITKTENLRNRFIALKVCTYLRDYIDLTNISLEDIVNNINNKYFIENEKAV